MCCFMYFTVVLYRVLYYCVPPRRLSMRSEFIEVAQPNAEDVQTARGMWPQLSELQIRQLTALLKRHKLSVASGDLLLLNGRWYITHAGLLRLANRSHCRGIRVQPVGEFCDVAA